MKYVDKKLNNLTDDKMKQIAKLVSEINYGSITLIIQDGVLVQIDKNEKIRIR
nr:YezD family protein [Clostridium sp. HBUAS56017]